ncbi:murein L,D-transpeptidase catalytic domain-containing protein [Flavobacterium sp.]|uniref:murein L,D-transpeptidase catalytic domain-containing protein n=1 Tax=Flavobacterium sp. TaxID=239 RepID=UPI00286E79CD|nr:murein L,D-transpeptidase catalytic domain family protein [Flavobacterium sp.]
MKKIFYFISLVLVVSFCKEKEDAEIVVSKNKVRLDSISKLDFNREIKEINYDTYYKEAQEYSKNNNLNPNKFILIDLGLHSGLKRFFIYDFKKKQVVKSFMVSHGCGNNVWGQTYTKENAPVSNEPDSHCSSIGKYVVLKRGISQWGIKVNYLLQGKDKTNSNAINRAIVLHSWDEVPNNEVYPDGTPEGWGCPAVSNKSMAEIDEILKENKKLLLWIIKSE